MPINLLPEATQQPINLLPDDSVNQTPVTSKQETIDKLSAPSALDEFGGQFAQGLLNIAPGLANLGIHGINALTGSNITPLKSIDMFPGKGTVPGTAGEIGSYFYGPGLESAAAKIPGIANAISKAGKIFENAPKAGKIVTNAASGALQGAVYNPENQEEGAVGGGLLGATLPWAPAAINKVLPWNMFRGQLPDNALMKALRVTAGTSTPLGDVINSPMLKRFYENVLAKIPFSGAEDKMQQVGNYIINRGQDLHNELLGNNDPLNYEQNINDALQDAKKDNEQTKNDLYTDFNDYADESNQKPNLRNFRKAIRDNKTDLSGMSLFPGDPISRSLFQKVANATGEMGNRLSSGIGENALPVEYEPSYKDLNILKGALKYKAKELRYSGDQLSGNVYDNLGNAAREDVHQSVNNSNNDQLINKYKTAEENYAKNFSPFLDNDIYKYTSGKADAQTIIQNFIKTGSQTDRSNLLSKLMDKLPDDQKNLVGYGYLKRAQDANGVLNPLKVKQLISTKSLGEKQFKTLFPDADFRQRLQDYTDLASKNSEALNIMQNNKTGARIADFLPYGLAAAGYKMGGIPGALGAGIGIPLLAKGAVNTLTSPYIREKVINKMLNIPKINNVNQPTLPFSEGVARYSK